METAYAPSERSTAAEISTQKSILRQSGFLEEIINIATDIALIVNKDRQVIFANNTLIDMLGKRDGEGIIGLRPGEILNCIHAGEIAGGCGTAEACRFCGAFNTILESQNTGEKVSNEVRLTTEVGGDLESLDLYITAQTIRYLDQIFTLINLSDISDKKRKEALERIFYHDIINLAGSLNGLIGYIRTTGSDNGSIEITSDLVDLLHTSTTNLIEEIKAQKELSLAERNELQIKQQSIKSIELLTNKIELIKMHDVSREKTIEISADSTDVTFISDMNILGRVLENLLKNAVEATDKHMTVTAGCYESENNVRFFIHNDESMAESVKRQMFQRSFSTKDKTRGLGTYSIRLLTERYLKGEVSFVSEEGFGTTFFIKIPKSI